jgi:transketolase
MHKQDLLAINAIRILGSDAVDKANSGHPGIVLGAAPIGFTLFAKAMTHDPVDPLWHNRDRFVLSAGHGSMLLYALLHLFGYDLPLDEIKRFRQFGSITPGHPEYGLTLGVEATTGPLGQGIAMGVGMAMAEAHLAARYNRDGFMVSDHYTYVLCGDGCLQEGVSGEACSLAGTLGLNKLILLYDRNRITIEGDIKDAFTEDVATRYCAYGWKVVEGVDGDDPDAILGAIQDCKASNKPSLIMVDTKIGRYSPLEGSEKTHGEPLGAANTAILRKNLGWPLDEAFAVPGAVYETCRKYAETGARERKRWEAMMADYQKTHPSLYDQYMASFFKGLPDSVDEQALLAAAKPGATRNASGVVLNLLKDAIPSLFGGSADLAPSNKSVLNDEQYFSAADYAGRNMHYGIREFAMAAISNGLSLHGGVRPYCATFLVFSDYLKAAVRLSALMHQGVLYILTHDSIGVGEDGPTHEPVEHLAAFRAMPNCRVFRPADAKETAAAYLFALEHKGPTLLALTRQNVPLYEGTGLAAKRGAYTIHDCKGAPEVILIGTGSEVELCMKAAEALGAKGRRVRVVSMPCMEQFFEQDAAYRNSVLPQTCRARVAVEAASSFGWHRVTGEAGELLCLDHFGASAPAPKLFEAFGFTVDNVVEKAEAAIRNAAV